MGGKSSKPFAPPQDSDIKGAIAPVEFKESLVSTLQESNTARNEMKVVLHEILRQPDTITEVRAIVEKIDRDAMKVFLSKLGFAIWSAFVFATGVAATVMIQNYLRK